MRMKMQLIVLMLGAFIPIACDPVQVDEGLFCFNKRERGISPHWGTMYALRNGEPWINTPWKGSLLAVTNDESETMRVIMDVFEDRPPQGEVICKSETLTFAGVPRHLGTYPLSGAEQQEYFSTYYHCDVGVGSTYVLDKSEGGFISIDAYDPSSCTIQGTFALTVIRDEPGGTNPNVDTLRFTEGRFFTHVITW